MPKKYTICVVILKGATMEKFVAEWIPYMHAYRVYDPHKPQYTVAYEEDEDKLAEESIAIRDADTMHVECY